MNELNASNVTRAQWLSMLARAPRGELERLLTEVAKAPHYRLIRGPESGMVMLRGRMGGTGDAFNLGEASVTRCTLQLDDGMVGHAYVLGRDARHAELAALLDAMMQREDEQVGASWMAALYEQRAARECEARTAAARTRVEFFTLVRGASA